MNSILEVLKNLRFFFCFCLERRGALLLLALTVRNQYFRLTYFLNFSHVSHLMFNLHCPTLNALSDINTDKFSPCQFIFSQKFIRI